MPHVYRKLADQFPGPSSADACSRAYLLFGDSAKATYAVLDALDAATSVFPIQPGDRSECRVIDIVRQPIEQGRAAMVLPEPTLDSLANYTAGHLMALELCMPQRATHQNAEWNDFSRFIHRYYDARDSLPWHVILRIYAGVNESGLIHFVKLWTKFESGAPNRPF